MGNTGPKGETGIMGLTGERGEKGEKGEKGDIGPMGLTGSIGPKGDMGPMGLTGAMGPMGLTGAMGETGPMGLTGSTGPRGEKGDTGQLSYVQTEALNNCMKLSNVIKADNFGTINFAAPVRFYTDVNFDKNSNIRFNSTGIGGSLRIDNRGLAIRVNENPNSLGGTMALMDSNNNIRWNSRAIVNGSSVKKWPKVFDPF